MGAVGRTSQNLVLPGVPPESAMIAVVPLLLRRVRSAWLDAP